jgi:hypothetical protein
MSKKVSGNVRKETLSEKREIERKFTKRPRKRKDEADYINYSTASPPRKDAREYQESQSIHSLESQAPPLAADRAATVLENLYEG